MSKKIAVLCTLILVVMLFTACNKKNPIHDLYTQIEAAVALEEGFAEVQQPLTEAEKLEYQLYEELLMMTDVGKVKSHAEKAIESALLREEYIKKEKASIDLAYEQFLLIEPIVTLVEEGQLKKKAEKLVRLMENRFEAYTMMYEQYSRALQLDIELYELIQDEKVTVAILQAQHDKVNESYQEVNSLKDEFNVFTNEFNEMKRDFYEEAELNVTYE